MIDVHCHLNFHSFTNDYDQIVQKAKEKGVTKIINVGTKIDSSRQAVELAEKYEDLYAIVGIHPHHADKLEDGWIEQLEKLTKQPKVVGIGECGLDYFSYKSNGIVDPITQKEVFVQQIKLAQRAKLPLQIHNRKAGEEIIQILLDKKSYLLPVPGMFHCFAGSEQVLKDALELGFYIGFDGNVTYDGLAPGENTDLKDIAKLTPINRMVVETDSPYLTPEPHRGTRNEPAYVILIAEFLAKIKGVSFEELEAQTTHNTQVLFNIETKR